MNHSLALYKPSAKREGRAMRRLFDNNQIVGRFEKWLIVCGKSKNTRVSYLLTARQFSKFLIDKPITSATKDDVRAFIGSQHAKGMTPATLQGRLSALCALFDCLQLGGQVRESAARGIPRRKVPKRLPRAMSEVQIEQLIAATVTQRDRAILELAYASGLRVSELANLRVEEINLEDGSLRVNRGKGDKDRIALFGSPAANALRAYLGNRKTGFLFQQQPGNHRWREPKLAADGRLSVRGIYSVIAEAAKRAGLTGVSPHVLRHSMATHCLNRGMDIRFVQELLGHTSLAATQKYLHVAIANLQAIYDKCFPGARP